MTVAWITSFSNDLYEATGKKLISTFESSNSCGKLYVAAERVPNLATTKPEAVVQLPDPGDSTYLQKFVSDNKSVIWHEFGGSWKGPCKCPNPKNPKDKRHKPKCPSSWFCKHSIRWFRKIIAIKSFFDAAYLGYTHVIWLDSDVVFKTKVDDSTAVSWFKGHNIFFLKGPKRKVWETGIFGFEKPKGLEFINCVFDYYMSGAFREQPRWDDSQILQTVATKNSQFSKIDLATSASGHADVVPHSPLRNYLTHNKGTHGRGLGLMK